MKLYNICAGRERGERAPRISCAFPHGSRMKALLKSGMRNRARHLKKENQCEVLPKSGWDAPSILSPYCAPFIKKRNDPKIISLFSISSPPCTRDRYPAGSKSHRQASSPYTRGDHAR